MLTAVKECRKCKAVKPLSDFHRSSRKPGATVARCRICVNSAASEYNKKNQRWKSAYYKEWKRTHREQMRRTNRAWYARFIELRRKKMNAYRAKARADLIALYGGACKCCGETLPSMLAIDHINGGGKKDRAQHKDSLSYYRTLLRLGRPRPDLRLLCCNCNWSRTRCGGICEHEVERQRRMGA